ncbi:unnamed protein product [Darwinula stevensoni]|uniref:Small ribosomal subunit protein mS29 n=1 Tax=Darwinula stevensoni TaxID=69355 RepID=A0A7R8XEN7_9CRUS|nr:unnamed protein product [Darwinula stevensoni]CAG0894192.1 unnamed protein product [Darwinula stevensoni]
MMRPALNSSLQSFLLGSIRRISHCRTSQADPSCHTLQDEGLFYTIPEDEMKDFFQGEPLWGREHDKQRKTFQEMSLMVRRPALEAINCLKQARPGFPSLHLVLYGRDGAGKTMSLVNTIHFALKNKWFAINAGLCSYWFKFKWETAPSETMEGLYNLPMMGVQLLAQIKLQNAQLLCKTLITVDGVNNLWYGRTQMKKLDKSHIHSPEFSLSQLLLRSFTNDWSNGAVVVTVDRLAGQPDRRESYMPRYLLGKEGFEKLDPFIPIHVGNYTEREFYSCVNYYTDRLWLQNPAAQTPEGQKELEFLSGRNPRDLKTLCDPL